jgi:hypothetical protein
LFSSKAKTKANNALRGDDVYAFMGSYAMFISPIFKVKEGFLHNKIMKRLDKVLKQELDLENAAPLKR